MEPAITGTHKIIQFLTGVFFTLFLCLLFFDVKAQEQKVVVVIIDGARYSETFGDPDRQYIPFMSELADEGTIIDSFYNDSATYTSRAVPALWCGTWTDVIDTVYYGSTTKYAKKPSLFEYFRKQTGSPPSNCYYVLPYIENLWLPSFNPSYGPDYWPQFHSVGENDEDVCNHAKFIIESIQPQLLFIYLADVDHEGHSGNWNNYIQAIQIADSVVGVVWNTLQASPYYAHTTTMFVTNDHGRHDDQHGGFQGHGDGCDGCRHIMFLATGPDIYEGTVTTTYRRIPDVAVTAASILGVEPELSSGKVIEELFKSAQTFFYKQNTELQFNINLNPAKSEFYSELSLPSTSLLSISLYNLIGYKVGDLYSGKLPGGNHTIFSKLPQTEPGVYIVRLHTKGITVGKKLVITE